MRSPASAIAWELRRRHRFGLAALVFYFAVLVAIRAFVLAPGQRVSFEENWSFGLFVIVPVASTFTFFLAVFSFGLAGDLAARQSIYPSRMFTLPVTNAALAGWPMLYGTVAVALLWIATRLLAVLPAGADVPLIWPALFVAVFLAWTQALTWLPYALPGLRVIITVLWLAFIALAAMLALHFKASERVMLGILAPHIPIAYLVARFAVGRARRGEVPDWRELFVWLARMVDLSFPRRRDPFASPARAQAWFEWQRYGRTLPVLTAMVLPFEMSLLFIFRDTPSLVFMTLVAALLTPSFMAAFVAATVRSSNTDPSTSGELSHFIATRPLTSASLVSAKLKATTWSALASWLLVLLALPLALELSGTRLVVVDGARRVADFVGTPRALAIALLGLSTLVVSTWKQLVQSLYVGMSGRAWLVKASVFSALTLLAVIVPLVPWVFKNPEVLAPASNALPLVLVVLAFFKILAVGWIALRLHDRRLITDRTILMGALFWDVAVFALFSLLVWLVPSVLVPSYLLAFMAILAVPLARLSAAPLALSWNRHR